jgi:hypothetical protein
MSVMQSMQGADPQHIREQANCRNAQGAGEKETLTTLSLAGEKETLTTPPRSQAPKRKWTRGWNAPRASR